MRRHPTTTTTKLLQLLLLLLLLLRTQIQRVHLLPGRQLTVIARPQPLHIQRMRRSRHLPSDGRRQQTARTRLPALHLGHSGGGSGCNGGRCGRSRGGRAPLTERQQQLGGLLVVGVQRSGNGAGLRGAA